MSDMIKGTVSGKGVLSGSLNVVYGKDGASAYEVAVKNGYTGTETEWLASLKGDKGDKGDPGDTPAIDQTYTPTSANAQSGTAVAQAVESETTRADNTYANVLKGLSSGEAAAMNDVSPVSHEMGVKVRGKNLLSNITEQSNYGVELTEYGDAYVLNGTCTQSANFSFAQSNLQAGTYTLSSLKSINLPNVTYALLQLILTPLDGGENVNVNVNNHDVENKGVSFTIDKEYKCQLRIRVQQGVTYDNYYLYPQLELGTAATAYAPYISDYTAVKVKKSGKNLSVNLSDRTDVFFTGSPTTVYNVTGKQLIKGFAVNGNADKIYFTEFTNSGGTVSFKTTNINYTLGIDCNVTSEQTYTLSAVTSGISAFWTVFLKDGLFHSYKTTNTFTVPDGCNQIIVLMRPETADTVCTVSSFQLELGSTVTAYAPYITPTEYTPNSDGTVEGVTSLYPATTLMTDTAGAIIDCEYNRDINKAYGELLKRISALETAAVNNA